MSYFVSGPADYLKLGAPSNQISHAWQEQMVQYGKRDLTDDFRQDEPPNLDDDEIDINKEDDETVLGESSKSDRLKV